MAPRKKGMDIFILLDRTGSMSGKWDEAVSSVNAYVKELKKDKAPDHITLAVFDHHNEFQFDVLRDSVLISKWVNFKNTEAHPRGMTPLYDAFAKIVSMAKEKNNKKTAIVVMTDGEENFSREVDHATVKAAVEDVKNRKWQLNFLGADFNTKHQAMSMGVAAGQTVNFVSGVQGNQGSAGNQGVMAGTAQLHSTYRNSSSPVDYDEDLRDRVGDSSV